MGKSKIFLLPLIIMSASCTTVSPQYQQTYHDPSLPNLNLIYIGDKDWVDKSAEFYKDNPNANKFPGVYGDITILEELPAITLEDR